MDIERIPRPEWSPLPFDGCRGVEGKVLLREPGLAIALLRFAPGATIHEHPAPHAIDVICLEGAGRVSVGGDAADLAAGDRVRWPAGVPHRLWTDDGAMTTLMIERLRD